MEDDAPWSDSSAKKARREDDDDADDANGSSSAADASERDALARRISAVEESLPLSAVALAVSTLGHLMHVSLPSLWSQPPQDAATEADAAWLAIRVVVRSPPAEEWPPLACRLTLSSSGSSGVARGSVSLSSAATEAIAKRLGCGPPPVLSKHARAVLARFPLPRGRGEGGSVPVAAAAAVEVTGTAAMPVAAMPVARFSPCPLEAWTSTLHAALGNGGGRRGEAVAAVRSWLKGVLPQTPSFADDVNTAVLLDEPPFPRFAPDSQAEEEEEGEEDDEEDASPAAAVDSSATSKVLAAAPALIGAGDGDSVSPVDPPTQPGDAPAPPTGADDAPQAALVASTADDAPALASSGDSPAPTNPSATPSADETGTADIASGEATSSPLAGAPCADTKAADADAAPPAEAPAATAATDEGVDTEGSPAGAPAAAAAAKAAEKRAQEETRKQAQAVQVRRRMVERGPVLPSHATLFILYMRRRPWRERGAGCPVRA